jgi:hypothetical protein
MKKLLLTGLIALLLMGCVGMPEPEGSGDSLIIGSLLLDFPDGFFDGAPTTVTRSIKVRIQNTSTKKHFTVSTIDGYFYFLTNGTDSYILESFEFNKEVKIKNTIYTLGRDIDRTITPVMNSLIYLGHITFTYYVPEDIRVDSRGGDETWHFDVSFDVKYKNEATLDFIREINPESSWLSYEPVSF